MKFYSGQKKKKLDKFLVDLLTVALCSHVIQKAIRFQEDGSDHACNDIISVIERTTWIITLNLDTDKRHDFYTQISQK